MVREIRVQPLVASYQRLLKWYLIPHCLTLSNIKYVSREKWSNPGKEVAPSPAPQCSSYWKGSLLVPLDYCRQLTITNYILSSNYFYLMIISYLNTALWLQVFLSNTNNLYPITLKQFIVLFHCRIITLSAALKLFSQKDEYNAVQEFVHYLFRREISSSF